MIGLGKTAAVADQTAGYGVLAKCVDCGYPVTDANSASWRLRSPKEKGVGGDGEGVNPLLN
jgi:hypothetical protein